MVGWIHLIETVIMSRYFYDRLSQEHKKIIDEAALEMIQKERQWYGESEEEALLQLVGKGVKVTRPDRRPFVKASQKVYEEWADRVGGMDLIVRIIRFDYSQNENSAKEKGRY
jgi:TRAP-type C4-dicarboxylate transport system substrate-binding protein